MHIKEQVATLAAHRTAILSRANLSLFSRRICKGTTQNGVVQSSEKGSFQVLVVAVIGILSQVSKRNNKSLEENRTP